jgi:hypothetical protein
VVYGKKGNVTEEIVDVKARGKYLFLFISYTDMPVGAPVLRPLDTRETVLQEPGENPCLQARGK